jgi:hypothetical protein
MELRKYRVNSEVLPNKRFQPTRFAPALTREGKVELAEKKL